MAVCKHACVDVCMLVTHRHTHFLEARMSEPLIFCLLDISFEVLFLSFHEPESADPSSLKT